MKSVTATLSNYLNNTKNIVSCDLYELQLANGNTYYYCDTDMDISYNGNIYKHNALLIERQNTKLNDRVVVDTMTVKISAGIIIFRGITFNVQRLYSVFYHIEFFCLCYINDNNIPLKTIKETLY